jgi:hypothetical protein
MMTRRTVTILSGAGLWLLIVSNGFAQTVDYFRIQNRWKPDQYLNIEREQVESSPIEPQWYSAMWSIEGTDVGFVRLRNRWKPNEYLHIEYGGLLSGAIQPQWYSAMWSIETADAGFVRLRNRWKPDQFIHIEYGSVQSGPIQPQWFSAMWSFGADPSIVAREAELVPRVAAGIEGRQVTHVVDGNGRERTIITDRLGTRVIDEHGVVIVMDGADRHADRVEDYGVREGGHVIADSDRPDPNAAPDRPDPDAAPDRPDPNAAPDRPDPNAAPDRHDPDDDRPDPDDR